ncbi:MAG: 30S ribosomal protein S24e [Acidilobaceae archaeon]
MSLSTRVSRRDIVIGGGRAEIRREKYNPLVGRIELEVEIEHLLKPTPSRVDVRRAIAEAYGVDLERVYVRSLNTEYGVGVTRAVIHIYDSVERAKSFEPEYVIKRNEGESS